MTGRENVYLNGAMLGMRRAEMDRKFDEIVAFAEWWDRSTPRETLFERNVHAAGVRGRPRLETEILLVDEEVLAVGDASFRRSASAKWVMCQAGRLCCSSATT